MPTAIFRTDLDFPLKTADANETPPTHADRFTALQVGQFTPNGRPAASDGNFAGKTSP
jgi:hypothetical protein